MEIDCDYCGKTIEPREDESLSNYLYRYKMHVIAGGGEHGKRKSKPEDLEQNIENKRERIKREELEQEMEEEQEDEELKYFLYSDDKVHVEVFGEDREELEANKELVRALLGR